MSKKVLLTVHPFVLARLEERMKLGYGSVQEVINEILRKELTKRRSTKHKKEFTDYFTSKR